jgi:anti-anti-sigma factor
VRTLLARSNSIGRSPNSARDRCAAAGAPSRSPSAASSSARHRAAAAFDQRHLVIDAGGIDFCDSSGLAAFVGIGNQPGTAGHGLAIASAQPIVSRIIEINGLHEVFVVAGTVEEALSRLQPELGSGR